MLEVSNEVKNWQVGARDGLQFFSFALTVQERFEFIRRLYEAGERFIESGSFVRSDLVPCMEDSDVLADLLMNSVARGEFRNSRFGFLTMNKQGAENAARIIQPDCSEMAVVVATSDDFCKRNMGVANIEQAFNKLVLPVMEVANKGGYMVRGYVSTAFVEPRAPEVIIDPNKVADAVEQLLTLGAYEVSIGDTTGSGTPKLVENLIQVLKTRGVLIERIAFHFHDTFGRAVDNVACALGHGYRIFDSSAGGLGGCKFAGSPVGNIATENLILAVRQKGLEINLNLDGIIRASNYIHQRLGHTPACQITVERSRTMALPEIRQLVPKVLVKPVSAYSSQVINVAVDERGVAYVSLNKGKKSNCFDEHLIAEITNLFQKLDKDNDVKVVVLSGEGKNFSAGADIDWMAKMADAGFDENLADAKKLSAMFESINACGKPVIARVHGAVMGGGNGLVAASDYAIAASSSRFAFSEKKLGIRPSTISAYCVPKLGVHNATILFCSGEEFSAFRAIKHGLIEEVTSAYDLDDAVEKAIESALDRGKSKIQQLSLENRKVNFQEIDRPVPTEPEGMIKLVRMVEDYMIAGGDRSVFLGKLARDIAEARTSPDGKEGIKKFLEKARSSK